MSNRKLNKTNSNPSREIKTLTPEQQSVIEAIHDNAPHSVGAFGAELAYQPISIAYVPTMFSDYIPLRGVPFGGLLAIIGKHCEQAQKGAAGIIWADLTEFRTDGSVQTVTALVYDVDGKLSYADVMARVAAFGAAAITYTTWNHHRTRTALEGKCVDSILQGRDQAADEPITSEQVAAYCAGNPRYSHLRNVAPLNGGAIVNIQKDGKELRVLEISHDPEEKSRIIVVLREPIPMAEVGQDGFRKLYHDVGTALLGAGVYDVACQNPSRIQWAPAKAVGSTVEHHCDLVPGAWLDWRSRWEALRGVLQQQRVRQTATATARMKERERGGNDDMIADIAQCLEHIPASVTRAEWFKVLAAIHNETGGSEAGLSLSHEWSATAPELYDGEEVDALWDRFDSDTSDRKKAGMGTLVYLARMTCEGLSLQRKRDDNSSDDINFDLIGG